MLLNQGRNSIRELIRSSIDTVRIGTGTTPATGADTALETEVANKPASTWNGATGETRARGRLSTAEQNGQILTEGGTTLDGVLCSRKTHSPLEKTALVEVEYEVVYRVVTA